MLVCGLSTESNRSWRALEPRGGGMGPPDGNDCSTGDLGGRGGGTPILSCSWDMARLSLREECFFKTDGVRVRVVVGCGSESSFRGSESVEKPAKCRSSGLPPLGMWEIEAWRPDRCVSATWSFCVCATCWKL